MIDLSIIILNHNTPKLLAKCLESISQNKNNKYNFQTIVLDNASTDDSVKTIQQKFPWVILICSTKNLGFSAGNNLAFKKATGKYILYLNSDTEIFPEALTKSIKFMDQNTPVGAFTPKTLLYNRQMDPDCHRGFPTPWASISYFLGLEKLFPQSRIFGQYHKYFQDLNKNHEIDAGFGTYLFTRKKVIDQIVGWDEKYFFYGEDLDLFYRIKQAGWQVMFYAHPLLYHHKGASSGLRKESAGVTQASRQIRLKTAKASIQAMEIFYKKFYQDKYPFWITWLIIMGIKIKGLLRVIYHYLKI